MTSIPKRSAAKKRPGAPGPEPEGEDKRWRAVRHGKVVVVTILMDILTGQDDVEALAELVSEHVGKATPRVVLNLAGVLAISSRLLGQIAAMSTRFKLHQGALRLAAMTDEVREVFIVTRLDRTIDIFDTVDEAVVSFKK